MGNGIYVSPEVMEEQGNNTVALANQLEGQINQLKVSKNALLDIWRGASATSFNESVELQLNNLNSFKDLINELGEKIITGAHTFSDAEEANAAEGRSLFDN